MPQRLLVPLPQLMLCHHSLTLFWSVAANSATSCEQSANNDRQQKCNITTYRVHPATSAPHQPTALSSFSPTCYSSFGPVVTPSVHSYTSTDGSSKWLLRSGSLNSHLLYPTHPTLHSKMLTSFLRHMQLSY